MMTLVSELQRVYVCMYEHVQYCRPSLQYGDEFICEVLYALLWFREIYCYKPYVRQYCWFKMIRYHK